MSCGDVKRRWLSLAVLCDAIEAGFSVWIASAVTSAVSWPHKSWCTHARTGARTLKRPWSTSSRRSFCLEPGRICSLCGLRGTVAAAFG